MYLAMTSFWFVSLLVALVHCCLFFLASSVTLTTVVATSVTPAVGLATEIDSPVAEPIVVAVVLGLPFF